MKKIALISSLVFMLLACSVSDISNILSPLFTPTPRPLATNTVYVTPTDTPTITVTLPTPTFTGTPTLTGGGFTETPTLISTDVISATVGTPSTAESTTNASISSIGAGNSLATTPEMVGFTRVQISGNILRWGGCEPSSITFTADVADPLQVASVTLWIQLKSQSGSESTKWETGAIMNGDNLGHYTYILTVKNVSHYDEYIGGWLQYQIVAKDASGNDVGRTQPYLNSITLSPCQ
jgi:hypothetical protein